MSYRPDIRIYNDAEDITDDVLAFSFGHGVDILNSKTGYNRLDSGGEMLLENWNDGWDAARLDSLGVIELRHATDVLCRCRSLEYEFDRRDAQVRVTLQTAQPAQYIGQLVINAGSVPGAGGSSLTLAQVVAASGVTITPEVGFSGELNMDQGTIYEASRLQFLNDVAVAGDGFVYEDHLGNLRYMRWDDSRPSTLQITPGDFYIDNDTAVSHLRRFWRRDAQKVKTLQVDYLDDGGTFDTGQRLTDCGYRQDVSGTLSIFHLTPLREVGGLTYTQDVDTFAYHSHFDASISLENVPPPFTGSHPAWGFNVTLVQLNPDDPREILVYVRRTGNVSWTPNDLWLNGAYRVDSKMWPPAFTENEFILLARDDGQVVLGELDPMPWPVDDAALPVLTARLRDRATMVPQVTKLCFSFNQQTQDKFNSLARHRIGSVAAVDLDVEGLPVDGLMANLYVRWKYEAGRYSCVEMHFLKLEERPTHGVFIGDTDHPVFIGDDQHRVRIEGA